MAHGIRLAQSSDSHDPYIGLKGFKDDETSEFIRTKNKNELKAQEKGRSRRSTRPSDQIPSPNHSHPSTKCSLSCLYMA